MKKFLYQFLFFSLIFLQGCQAEEQYGTNDWKKSASSYQSRYVDFESFKKGRLCADVRFTCLVESQDKLVVDTPLENGLDSFELTAEVELKFKKIVKQWHEDYDEYHDKPHTEEEKKASKLISDLNEKFFDKVQEKRFLIEMEAQLEKEFPGFWRDTPKKVRYRWIQRAMNKAKVFGYDPKQNNAMVELCARIGLNFDKDPKWEAITKFISKNKFNIGSSCDYIDFTVFNKDYSPDGDKYTDWYLREALSDLPYPKRPVPRLND